MCYNFGADTKSDGELTHLAAVIVTSKKSSLVTIIASTHQWTSAVLMGVESQSPSDLGETFGHLKF